MARDAYTLATYRVKTGREDDFIAAWQRLASTFKSLPSPPISGTLIRHRTDRTLFHSFGPWHDEQDVKAMRQSEAAMRAFAEIHALCEDMTPGDYEVILHIEV